MTKTNNSEKIWQKVKAKVKEDCKGHFHSYMYNDACGKIGTKADALADWEYCLGGIDTREQDAEKRISSECKKRMYPVGFVEVVYSGIIEITPNQFLGPPIEPPYSHIRYPMDVFVALHKKINDRELVYGYTKETRRARFEGRSIDLSLPVDPYILRSLGVFAREILGNFPIEETFDAIKNVKRKLVKESVGFGEKKAEALHTLEDYLNQQVLLPILISENHKFSPENYIKSEIGDLSHRAYIDHAVRNDNPPRKKVRFALDGSNWTYANFTSDEYCLNDLVEKGRIII